MNQGDVATLLEALRSDCSQPLNAKAKRYVSKFFERQRTGKKISGEVVGNHGTYTVSVEAKDKTTVSACSCYIGASGFCHHCQALAAAFLNEPESFTEVKRKTRQSVKTLEDLAGYLKGVTLDALLQELKAQGISQKQMAESIGMSPSHLTAIKSSEKRHRYFHELGATKLACLWMIEHFRSGKV
jgi:uncharacterized Zn finger protein